MHRIELCLEYLGPWDSHYFQAIDKAYYQRYQKTTLPLNPRTLAFLLNNNNDVLFSTQV